MKYIDAEKLIAEIERLYEIARNASYNGEVEGEMTAYDKILSLITSLQQEQPEVDEDFFFDEILKVYDGNNKYPPRNEEELTMLETVARHFYELGLNAGKEE